MVAAGAVGVGLAQGHAAARVADVGAAVDAVVVGRGEEQSATFGPRRLDVDDVGDRRGEAGLLRGTQPVIPAGGLMQLL